MRGVAACSRLECSRGARGMTGNSRNWSRFLGSGYAAGCLAAGGARLRYLSAAICIAVRGAPATVSTSTCSTNGVFSGRPQCRACSTCMHTNAHKGPPRSLQVPARFWRGPDGRYDTSRMRRSKQVPGVCAPKQQLLRLPAIFF